MGEGVQMGMSDNAFGGKTAQARAILNRMNATKRYDPPPAEEADAWEWSIHDEEDDTGLLLSYGYSVWYPKDLFKEWQRLNDGAESVWHRQHSHKK
jgi:hypothetical protein